MAKNKFRFYDRKNKEWLEHKATAPDLFASYDDNRTFVMPYDKNIVICQFSMFKSGDEVDLYQGSIVEMDSLIYLVVLKNGMFALERDGDDLIPLFNVVAKTKYLGNFFDDPRLLRK